MLIQLACAQKGLILCTLNPVYKVPELEYALAKSGAKLLFLPGQNSDQKVVNDFTGIVSKISFGQTNLEKVVNIDGCKISDLPVPCLSLNELMDQATASHPENKLENVQSDDPAIIMFTSV